jgi:hypothetical protein
MLLTEVHAKAMCLAGRKVQVVSMPVYSRHVQQTKLGTGVVGLKKGTNGINDGTAEAWKWFACSRLMDCENMPGYE